MSVFTRVLRAGEGKKVRRLAEIVPVINDLEPAMEALSDEELRHRTVEFRQRLADGETLDDLLVDAFAVVREASWRVLGQRHFDVQLMGGMALHFGWIAEMKTGEGKTLVSTMPVYLNALAGKGVHVVTVNDYLATRDAEWMGRVYRWLGLTVGRVGPDVTDPALKRQAYASDVTYGTNTEFGFDYLRDNMQMSRQMMVQRGHVFAIVDEVDSILIDEARTPLIISGPADEAAKLYYQFASIARTLERDLDYEVDEEKRHVVPLEPGIEKVERAVGLDNLYDNVSTNYVHQLIKALEAKELYHRDKEYLVDQGEVKIIDEFTGRTLEGRRWSDGLHQAVEAKERVRIKEENHTWATVTLQNYFRLYEKLAGMTGTAETEAAEFANTYNLPVVPIPTNKPMVRVDEPDLVFKSEGAKFNAVVDDIVERNERGQPVLVGTASVVKSELLSRLLDKRGIDHQVLNAKQHFREAEIVAQAGRLGSVTVATNMAGRGVDIILGGNPELLAKRQAVADEMDLETDEGQEAYAKVLSEFEEVCGAEAEEVRQAGGLYVLGSERHESRRIDNQLRGRSGRQGDPGESRFYLSLEDDLMRLFATGAMSWVMGRTIPEDMPIEAKMVTKAIERAQHTVEGRNSEIRKDVLKYDEVMNEQRKIVYARRLQVIDGEDLEAYTRELLSQTVEALVHDALPSDYSEEWELERLLKDLAQYYPTAFSVDDLMEGTNVAHVIESVDAEALAYYERHSASLPGGDEQARQVEREVMLRVIDQRWRDHLAEMDYLREGINLRAMGQQDPLVAWQREGFEMFGQLMDAIDDDYLRYVLHVEVVTTPPEAVGLDRAVYEAAEDPVAGTVALASQLLADQGVDVAAMQAAEARAVARASLDEEAGGPRAAAGRSGGRAPQPGRRPVPGPAGRPAARPVQDGGGPHAGDARAGREQGRIRQQGARQVAEPSAGARQAATGPATGAGANAHGPAKVGRNDPCWCGSGKKYKLCHGAA
jgi:preprotein translocase subunit SecA